jgi:hypothetical protein
LRRNLLAVEILGTDCYRTKFEIRNSKDVGETFKLETNDLIRPLVILMATSLRGSVLAGNDFWHCISR